MRTFIVFLMLALSLALPCQAMVYLKEDTAATVKMGPFVDDSDGKTAETGLTITQADIRLSKNGGDFAQTHNAAGATHDEFGYYDVPLDMTDTNTAGRLTVTISESGALPVVRDFMVINANVFDSLCAAAATDYLQVDTTTIEDADATDYIESRTLDHSDYFDPNNDSLGDPNLIFLKDVAEGDSAIITTTTPWRLRITHKTTGATLVDKELKDINGNSITNIRTPIGSRTEP